MKIKMILLLGAIITSGCAGGAVKLKPDSIDADEGAVAGRIQVFSKGEDVTSDCYVELKDSSDSRTAYLSLDETGWVFTAAKAGKTHIAWINCGDSDIGPYETKDMHFTNLGGGKLTYFGHLTVHLKGEKVSTGRKVAMALMLGAFGSGIDAANRRAIYTQVKVAEDKRAIQSEYLERFPEHRRTLVFASRLATQPPTKQEPVEKGPKE